MRILNKIIGGIICCIGLAVWYIDYLVFTAIGSLAAWIAGAVGITGNAVLGLQVIGWIVTFSTMLFIFVIGITFVYSGLKLITGD